MLTDKQEQFARKINEGLNQSDAYRAVYDCENSAAETIWTEASLLASNPKVADRIKELRNMSAIPSIMTAQERLELLSSMARGEEKEHSYVVLDGKVVEVDLPIKTRDRMTAIDMINKMQGEYVTKVAAEVESTVNINIELTDD